MIWNWYSPNNSILLSISHLWVPWPFKRGWYFPYTFFVFFSAIFLWTIYFLFHWSNKLFCFSDCFGILFKVGCDPNFYQISNKHLIQGGKNKPLDCGITKLMYKQYIAWQLLRAQKLFGSTPLDFAIPCQQLIAKC